MRNISVVLKHMMEFSLSPAFANIYNQQEDRRINRDHFMESTHVPFLFTS